MATSFKSILVASSGYPPFVKQLVDQFSRMGIRVTVIGPQSVVKHLIRGVELLPKTEVYTPDGGVPVTVLRPYTISLGNRFPKLNDWFIRNVVNRTARRQKNTPDICYGHFWHYAYSLYPYAKKHKFPLFCATGEAVISIGDLHSVSKLRPFCDYLKGVICVSTKNKNESIEKGLTDGGNCEVIPNAIDNGVFKLLNKKELRDKYKIEQDDFIVAFTGWYDNNKGVERVAEAITKLGDKHIKSFFIGDQRGGSQSWPKCDGILHTGRLPHEKLPEYLNMADVFVLPTLHEGCNNAIIEAMACGLPIISSDRDFNHDVLDASNSILVAPLNIDAIADAISKLKNDADLRQKMSNSALDAAKGLNIASRAEKIINFMRSKL